MDGTNFSQAYGASRRPNAKKIISSRKRRGTYLAAYVGNMRAESEVVSFRGKEEGREGAEHMT